MLDNCNALYLSKELRTIEMAVGTAGLMEKAGLAIATLAKELAADNAAAILVLVGPGNNGGDALVAARHLKQWWHRVSVVLAGDPQKFPPDARAAYDQWLAAGGTVEHEIPLADWALVLDGLFGIGLQRPVAGTYLEFIEQINALPAPVLAIDIPSGLCGDTGRVLGAAVHADHTLTFVGLKPGLYTLDGPSHAGIIHFTDLGVATENILAAQGHLLELEALKPLLPSRARNSHKGSFGSVAVIGGADAMTGAALLAARAALLSGAGRVYAALLAECAPAVDLQQAEIMQRSPDKLTELPQLDCVVIGPGLGQSATAKGLLEYWLAQDVPLLLDADALNLLSAHQYLKHALQNRQAPSIITPHPGEAAKLLACDNTTVQQDRIHSCLRLAQELHAICVLKGAGTICAEPDGQWYINTSGNPGLASAGTGDVLSGIIGSLVAQGLMVIDATRLGVYLHGAAADALVAQGIGPVGLTASELAPAVRNLINQSNKEQ